MGIGERHCDCLALVSFYLGDALSWRRLIFGDASSWRRPVLAMFALGVTPPGRRLTLTLTLTLSTPGYGTVQLL